MNPLYEQMPVSIFERMNLAAAQHDAVNLGQGFPDFGWPDEILDAAAKAITNGSNQYAPSRGLPQLRQAIAEHYGRHFGQQLDPDHVCVTSGATEALAGLILATVEPGDEVIVFTPAYDSYAPMIRRAGATPREVALRPPSWRIDRDALKAVVTSRTRAILFNNPHNPTGRLFDTDELQVVADMAIEHDLTVLSDEVWEHVLLDGGRFTPLASLPGMAERTLKAGSAGKIIFANGLEGRLDRGIAREGGGRRSRSSVPDLLDSTEPAVRCRLRARAGGRLDRTDAGAVRLRAHSHVAGIGRSRL